MANIIPGTWTQVCLVTIWDGTTFMSLSAKLLPSELVNLGDRPVEYEPNLAGGRNDILNPEEDTVITFEGRFIGIGDTDSTTPSGLAAIFYDGTDISAPFSVDNYLAQAQRKSYNLWFLWSDDSTVAAATGAIVSGANALRIRCVAARFISCKPNFSENKLKWTCMFRVPARTVSGAKTITAEEADGTASMAALGTLTST